MSEYIVELDGKHSTALRLAFFEEMRGGDFIGGEIVRCRDCRYSTACEAPMSGKWMIGNCGNPRFRGSIHASNITHDGFCAFGERRSDE